VVTASVVKGLVQRDPGGQLSLTKEERAVLQGTDRQCSMTSRRFPAAGSDGVDCRSSQVATRRSIVLHFAASSPLSQGSSCHSSFLVLRMPDFLASIWGTGLSFSAAASHLPRLFFF
jgi:hypothetical protein